MREKKDKRPSVSPVIFYCKECNSMDEFMITLQERFNKTEIKQNCSKCRKITTWSLDKNSEGERAVNDTSTV